MKPLKRIVYATRETNAAGSKLVRLTLSCGHVTVRAVRNSQVTKTGALAFGANRLPCRFCRVA